MSASPHAKPWPRSVRWVLGFAGWMAVSLMVWFAYESLPTGTVPVPARPVAPPIAAPVPDHEPVAPPSALWDAERAEQLVVKELLKERAR